VTLGHVRDYCTTNFRNTVSEMSGLAFPEKKWYGFDTWILVSLSGGLNVKRSGEI
jgi:hypothetical protein